MSLSRWTTLTLATLATVAGCTAQGTEPGVATITAATATCGRLDPVGGVPPVRDGHAMTGDTTDETVVLVGGKGANSRYLNDLWTYRPGANAWAELEPSGGVLPAGRFGHGLVYDPTSRTMLLFGGVATTGLANDLWSYKFADNTWTPVETAGSPPPARVYPSLAWDDVTGTAVLFGGWTGDSEYGDTWSFDPVANTWRRSGANAAPRARWGASMVYDASTSTIILFGGIYGSYDGSSKLNDTWEYDPAHDSWTQLAPRGTVPPARAYASMVYDSATGTTLLFGGFAGSDGLLADVWAFDHATDTWTRLDAGPTGPSRRDFSAAVYDPGTNRTILFGGLTGDQGNIDGTLLNDTWSCT